MAKILELALGPVPKMMEEMVLMFELMAIPDFILGFVEGMVQDGNLPEIDQCHDGITPLVSIFNDFVSHIESFEIISAIGDLESFIYHFQLDFMPCTQMQDDMDAIVAWGEQFKDPMALLPTVVMNIVLHKRKIESSWADEQTAWNSGDYITAGKDMADIVTMAVGPIEEAQVFL